MDDKQETVAAHRPTRIIGLAVLATACAVGAAAVLVYASDIILILFLAVLFGVFLSRISHLLTRYLPLAYGWCLAIIVASFVLLLAGGIALFGVQVDAQVTQAGKRLETSEKELNRLANRYPTLKSVLASTPFLRDIVQENGPREKKGESSQQSNSGDVAGRSDDSSSQHDKEGESSPSAERAKSGEMSTLRSGAKQAVGAITRVFSTTLGLLVNSLLIFFVGLFIAAAPKTYRDGVVVLFAPDRRERCREVLDKMGDALWHWLIGQFGSMLITGIGAGVLLFLLGVPMAISLGVVTGLLTFIPNIGAFISLSLAMLFALPQGGTTVLIVLVGYMTLQLFESYVVTPIIQQQQVSLPPALLISFQAVMGVLFGFLGAAVASPVLAAGKVGVEEVYVKDVLENAGES